jgi:hypothetical protein
MRRAIAKSEEPIYRRIARLRYRKCRLGHSRRDAFVEIDHRTGGVRLRCRVCHKERLRRYHAEGRPYRYV